MKEFRLWRFALQGFTVYICIISWCHIHVHIWYTWGICQSLSLWDMTQKRFTVDPRRHQINADAKESIREIGLLFEEAPPGVQAGLRVGQRGSTGAPRWCGSHQKSGDLDWTYCMDSILRWVFMHTCILYKWQYLCIMTCTFLQTSINRNALTGLRTWKYSGIWLMCMYTFRIPSPSPAAVKSRVASCFYQLNIFKNSITFTTYSQHCRLEDQYSLFT